MVGPLDERVVIDMDSDEELPLYTPMYMNNVLRPDHGDRPAARRRRTPGVGTPRGLRERLRVRREQRESPALQRAHDPEVAFVEG